MINLTRQMPWNLRRAPFQRQRKLPLHAGEQEFYTNICFVSRFRRMIQWTWMHSTDILGGDCIYKTIRTATFLLLPFFPNMSPWSFTNDCAIVMIDMNILPDQNEIYFWWLLLSLPLCEWAFRTIGQWTKNITIIIMLIIARTCWAEINLYKLWKKSMLVNIFNVMMACYPISEWEVPFQWEWLVRKSL